VCVASRSESAPPTNLKFGLLSVAFIFLVAVCLSQQSLVSFCLGWLAVLHRLLAASRFGVVCTGLISLRENLSKNAATVPAELVVPTGTNQVEQDPTET